jgi:hypothetical protein
MSYDPNFQQNHDKMGDLMSDITKYMKMRERSNSIEQRDRSKSIEKRDRSNSFERRESSDSRKPFLVDQQGLLF